MGDCGEAVCGGDVPDQYQVGAAVLQGPGEVATEFRECSQHLFKHGFMLVHKVNHPSDRWVVRWSRGRVDTVVTLQTILGFNEPDQGEQHAMSPAEAAAEWMEIMARYRHDDGDGDDGDCDEYDGDDDQVPGPDPGEPRHGRGAH